MEENFAPDTFALQIDNSNIPYLTETARWGKFLSIVGFIFCGLMIIYALFGGSLITTAINQDANQLGSSLPDNYAKLLSTFFTIIILLFAVLYFFPSMYMFHFASKMQSALKNNDQIHLNNSFKNLKSCLKFWGILLIIILSFYAIVIIFSLVALSLAH